MHDLKVLEETTAQLRGNGKEFHEDIVQCTIATTALKRVTDKISQLVEE